MDRLRGVSPGCQHCYAEQLDKRPAATADAPTPRAVRSSTGAMHAPPTAPRRRTGASCSGGRRGGESRQADARVLLVARRRVRNRRAGAVARDLFDLIERTPNLIWQLLTKRPQNVRPMTRARWFYGLPANVWVGTTVETSSAPTNASPPARHPGRGAVPVVRAAARPGRPPRARLARPGGPCLRRQRGHAGAFGVGH